MEYVKLGNTGLEVSKLCLGCMGFGKPNRGTDDWSVGEHESHQVIKYALDAGINFFDTANIYSDGSSEEILGTAVKKFMKREEIVLATKAYFPMFEGSNAKGLSRKALFREIDRSLKRLQTDYVDLFIIHRWDYHTPIEETMAALHDIVKSGKARYIGASSMHAWQFAKAQFIAEKYSWTKFVSMQNLYNLLYREEEREMIPLIKDQGVAMTPWSPLSHGKLAKAPESLENNQPDYLMVSDKEIVTRVHQLAKNYSVSPAQIALAWNLSKDYVTAPIVGARKSASLADSIGALTVTLSNEDIVYLEEPYQVRKIAYYK